MHPGRIATLMLVVALLSGRCMALDRWPKGGVSVVEIEKWDGYKSTPREDSADGNVPMKKEADAMEVRLRKELPDLIGKLTGVTRNPVKAWRGAGCHFQAHLHPCVACWSIKGEYGNAFAMLDSEGGIKLNIAPDSKHPLAGEDRKGFAGRAKELLTKFWGAAPPLDPQGDFEWFGVDGNTNTERTNVIVKFNRYEEWSAKESDPLEAWIETGMPFDHWKTMTAEKVFKIGVLPTERSAIANAVLQCGSQYEWRGPSVGSIPKHYQVTSVINSSRIPNPGGLSWTVNLLVEADGQKQILGYTADAESGAFSAASLSDPAVNIPKEQKATIAEVQGWPEYKAAFARQAKALGEVDADPVDDAGVKTLAAHAVAIIRPDLNTKDMEFKIKRESPGFGNCEYVPNRGSSGDEFACTFGYMLKAGKPCLTICSGVTRAFGNEPDLRDRKAWTQYASEKFGKIFGTKPGTCLTYMPETMSPDGFIEGQTGRVRESRWELTWRYLCRNVPIDAGQAFDIEQTSGGYSFYWYNPCPAGDVEKLLREINKGEIDIDPRNAATVAVNAAHLNAPDVPINTWRVTRVDFMIHTTWSLPPGVNPDAVWQVEINQPSGERVNGGLFIDEIIDAKTRKVLDFMVSAPPII